MEILLVQRNPGRSVKHGTLTVKKNGHLHSHWYDDQPSVSARTGTHCLSSGHGRRCFIGRQKRRCRPQQPRTRRCLHDDSILLRTEVI